MRPDGPLGGCRPEEEAVGEIVAGMTGEDDRLSPHVPLRISKSRRNATALYAPSLDAPDPSEAAAAAAAVAAMPSATPTGPFDPASAALKPRRNAYAMYSTDGAQMSGGSSGGSGETAAVAVTVLAGGSGAQGGEDSRKGSRSAPLLQMAAAVLGGGTVADGVEGASGAAGNGGYAAAAGGAGAHLRSQQGTAASTMQPRLLPARMHSHDAAARLVAGLQPPGTAAAESAAAGQHQTAAGAGAGAGAVPGAGAAAVGALAGGSGIGRGEASAGASSGAHAEAAAPWGRRAGSAPSWHDEDDATAAAALNDDQEALTRAATSGMDYAADDLAASAPLLMEGGVPLTLPPPVSVQVSSRSRKTVDNSGKGKLTLGVVGVFHPQLYMKGGDCIEVNGKMISRGRCERAGVDCIYK